MARVGEVCVALDEGAEIAGTAAFRAFAALARAWRDNDPESKGRPPDRGK